MEGTIDNDFAMLYKRNFKAVYRICYIFMQNCADAEDCTEDTFLRAITTKATFEDEKHERAWLTVVARNICKDRLTHWWNKKTVSISDYEETLKSDETQHDDVLDAVMKLPEKYKDIVYLHYYEGYKTEEMAKMLKRPVSTVRNQLRDAREKLKVVLGGIDL
ncbi:MAG: RNA polymerase sigma factor [Ruminiclostridium sp.]